MLPFAGGLGMQLFHPVAPNFTDQQLWLSSAPTDERIHLAGAERCIRKGSTASQSPRQVLPVGCLGPNTDLEYEEAHQSGMLWQQRCYQCFVFCLEKVT